MTKKLWEKQKSSHEAISAIIEEFTVGKDKTFDLKLAEFDVLGSLAHTQMLNKVGLLTDSEYTELEKGLQSILKDIREDNFKIEDGIEDIHSQIEYLLTKSLGEIGKKIHSGRSRNDQVLLDLKLYFKSEIKAIAHEVSNLFDLLQKLSEQHKNILLPGYTHFQIAMPSSFGLWFGAYAESLVDDMEMLSAAYNICDKNPLGSAAGYGTSLPLDRQMTTDLLDFKTMNYNVVYAQMTRGKTEKVLAMALSTIASTLSKMSYDVCLYMSQNMGFLSFPSEFTTGSSIMPHKKNPDVFELIRAKCNLIQALPNEISYLINNLPSGYHRDFQLSKESLFPAISNLKNCLKMMAMMLSKVQVNETILEDEKYDYLFSVEAVNKAVLNGMSFREAYQKVGLAIENNEYVVDKNIHHTMQGSIGNLCNSEIKLEFEKVLRKILD
jgi:argininosuccinate lyase